MAGTPDIDALYGLEPVIEAGNAVPGQQALTFASFRCPWCGEQNETEVDATTGDGAWIEDCTVCCQPMELTVEFDPHGNLQRVHASR